MTDCLKEDTLARFVEQHLSADELASVKEHFEGCSKCLRLATEVAAICLVLPESPPPEPSSVTPSAWTPPETFDQFRLVRLLGQGAMGKVYEGHDIRLDRRVAVKFIAMTEPDDASRERFLIEARSMARVAHPNVITAHYCGEVQGRPYLVSEYVAGQGLDLLDRPVTWQRALAIGIDLARGLRAAHRCGVLHRDIKPANVILNLEGQAKLVDFGLARMLDIPPEWLVARSVKAAEDGSASLTGNGAWIGTPLYMAPEIWHGKQASSRSDVYSLGMLLYELCAGRTAYANANTVLELKAAAETQDAQPLRELAPSVDLGFAAVVDHCLLRDPAERFASGEDLCQALEALADRKPERTATAVRRRLVVSLFLGMVLLCATGLSVWLWTNQHTDMVRAPGVEHRAK